MTARRYPVRRPARRHRPRHVSRFLPRLVLCLCLLLDGMAPAFAALRMHAQATTDAQATHQAQASDCHEAMDPAPSIAGEAPAKAADECLVHCLDLCLQQGPALAQQALPMTWAGPGQAPRATAQPRPPTARPFPPLRPPIA
jgi:hypothetical protein